MNDALFEACVETSAEARDAAAHGANRLELCMDLAYDGCTPPLPLAAECVAIGLPVIAIIRPRPGDFVYQLAEVDAMCRAMSALGAIGVAGFATGALTRGDTIDASAMSRLVAAADARPVTLHRAFDRMADREGALDQLVALGVRRVLSSGGPRLAEDGLVALRRLVGRADGRIEVIAAGGIRPHNVRRVIAETRVPAVHARWSGWQAASS